RFSRDWNSDVCSSYLEKNLVVRGIAFKDQITRITVSSLPNELHTLSTIFGTLAKNGLNVDIIIQNMTDKNHTNISFSVKTQDLRDTLTVLENNKDLLKYEEIQHEDGLAKVSIVGSGMVSNPGVAADMFRVLASENIEVRMVSTSEIKVSTVVEQGKRVRAVEALHDSFNLAAVEEEKEKVRL